MTIPSTGPLSLRGSIITEFGGTKPDSLGEYYRGGSHVATGATNTIPVSGQVSFSNYRGAKKPSTGGGGGTTPPSTQGYVFNGASFRPSSGSLLVAGSTGKWALAASASRYGVIKEFGGGNWTVTFAPPGLPQKRFSQALVGAVWDRPPPLWVNFTVPATWKGKIVPYTVQYLYSTQIPIGGTSAVRTYKFT